VQATVFAADYPTLAELAATPPPAGATVADWTEALRLTRRAALWPSGLMDVAGEPLLVGHPPALLQFFHALDREAVAIAQTDRDRDRRVARAQRREALAAAERAGFPGSAATEAALRAGQMPADVAGRVAANFHAARQLANGSTASPLTPTLVRQFHACLLAGLDAEDTAQRSGADDWELEQLCRFANAEEPAGFLHPFSRAALLRYRVMRGGLFVAGHGRLAEILFGWSLRRAGYVRVEELAWEEIICRDAVAHDRAVARVAEDRDATHLVIYLASAWRGAERIADESRRADERERDAGVARWRGLGTYNFRQQALLMRALQVPETDFVIAAHQRSHGITHETARMDLFDLEARGLLVSRREGRAYRFRAVPDLRAHLSGQLSAPRPAAAGDDAMPVNLL